MSTKAAEKSFLEFSGTDAAIKAKRAATRFQRKLDVCEYGVDIGTTPLTMVDLKNRVMEDGYAENLVSSLVEGDDAHWAQFDKPWWA